MLLSFLTIYSTNALGMPAVTAGAIAMASKIVDAITDLVAGILVDKTNTKLGKGRPYELAVIGLWACTWLLFSVPAEASMTVKCIWIFLAYTCAESIFATLLNANGNAYMIRAFREDSSIATLHSIGGIIVTAGVAIFNVVFPIFEAKIIYDAAGWSRLVAFIAIPLAILGLMRFFFIPEVNENVGSQKAVTVKDLLHVLKINHYIYPAAAVQFIAAISSALGITNYYFLYIVGDVAISGPFSMLGFISMLSMLAYPALMKKMTARQLIQFGTLVGIPGAILCFFAKDNLVLFAIGGVISSIGSLPGSFMSNLLVINCGNYNEYRGNPRMDGALASVVSFFNKLGSAFGSLVTGFMLTLAHFDGTAAVQPDSALLMIRFLQTLFPMILGLISFFILFAYKKLDDMKPEIDRILAERRAEAAGKENA